MIFVLAMLYTIVYDRKNENHWSLLVIRYSLLGIQTPASHIDFVHEKRHIDVLLGTPPPL